MVSSSSSSSSWTCVMSKASLYCTKKRSDWTNVLFSTDRTSDLLLSKNLDVNLMRRKLHLLEGQGLHSLLKLYAPTWRLKRLSFMFCFLLWVFVEEGFQGLNELWCLIGGCLIVWKEETLPVVELTVLGGTRCIILSTRNPWFVCSLLPRYMCNIVQKCPTLRRPVGWVKVAGKQRLDSSQWHQNATKTQLENAK